MTRVASIGECMIELKQAGGGLYSRGFGGDTLNTPVYLARLGVAVDYITALGDDPLSSEMIAGWVAEGVGTGRVMRVEGKLPGIYLIGTDAKGERRFFHWRENAAVRSLLDLPQTADLLQSLGDYDLIYLSAISLAIYRDEGRARLLNALRAARARGTRIVFDTNFRFRLWPDLDVARAIYAQAFETADIVLASTEDLQLLYPGEDAEALLARIPTDEVVLRVGRAGKHRARRRRNADPGRRSHPHARGRYHGGRRQFCRRLHRRASCRCRSDRCRARGPSPGRRGGLPSRRDHSA